MIEKLHSIGISNAMITSTVIMLILCAVAVIGGRRIESVPSSKLQNALEAGIEKLYRFLRISWVSMPAADISRW